MTRATANPKQTTNKIDDIFEEVINGQYSGDNTFFRAGMVNSVTLKNLVVILILKMEDWSTNPLKKSN